MTFILSNEISLYIYRCSSVLGDTLVDTHGRSMAEKGTEKICGLCRNTIKDKKSYRLVSTHEDFSRIFKELSLNVKNYVCKFCVNKLNRLARIDDDIKTRLTKLYEKRNELFSEIKETVISKAHLRTPVSNKRERQKNTPTPRKPKIRRLLPFNSPEVRTALIDKPLAERSILPQEKEPWIKRLDQSSTNDASTQTKTYHEKDFDVKVSSIILLTNKENKKIAHTNIMYM